LWCIWEHIRLKWLFCIWIRLWSGRNKLQGEKAPYLTSWSKWSSQIQAWTCVFPMFCVPSYQCCVSSLVQHKHVLHLLSILIIDFGLILIINTILKSSKFKWVDWFMNILLSYIFSIFLSNLQQLDSWMHIFLFFIFFIVFNTLVIASLHDPQRYTSFGDWSSSSLPFEIKSLWVYRLWWSFPCQRFPFFKKVTLGFTGLFFVLIYDRLIFLFIWNLFWLEPQQEFF
jgi:hypothetical protein